MIALITALLLALGPLALLLVVVILFAETGLLVGFVLPGDGLLFTVGVLVAAGALPLPLWLVLLGCALAAVLGDQVGDGVLGVEQPALGTGEQPWTEPARGSAHDPGQNCGQCTPSRARALSRQTEPQLPALPVLPVLRVSTRPSPALTRTETFGRESSSARQTTWSRYLDRLKSSMPPGTNLAMIRTATA